LSEIEIKPDLPVNGDTVPKIKNVYEMPKKPVNKTTILDIRHYLDAKKLQKPIHIAKYRYKKREKVNRSVVKDSLTTEHHPLFTKFSIIDDIQRHSHSSLCCRAVAGMKVICHGHGH
jgi:hypothetical protein